MGKRAKSGQGSVRKSQSGEMRENHKYIVLQICGVIFFGTLNNFGGKMKAEAMGTYNFVTGCVDNWIHTIVTCLIVAVLAKRGEVTRSQVAYVFRSGRSWATNGVWKYIAIASVSDVANNITGLASQPYLTTLMMSLMDQATTPFTVICSFLMLGTRYTALESGAVLAVLGAAIAAVVVVQQENSKDNSPFWAIFAASTTSFAAVSYVLKELTFRKYADYRRTGTSTPLLSGRSGSHLHFEEVLGRTAGDGSSSDEDNDGKREALLETEKGGRDGPQEKDAEMATAASEAERAEMPQTLNVFLVSLIVTVGGSITCIPVALISRTATNDGSAVEAMHEGFQCLLHCENALPAYIFATIINYCFNFCLLALTGRGSALLAFVSLKVVVPCTALCSPFSWPLIGPKPVSSGEWSILVVMLLSIALFRYGNLQRERLRVRSCCWPLCGFGPKR